MMHPDSKKTPPEKPQESESESGGEVPEIGAKPNRLNPTRYGDWELNGKCVDF